MDDPIEISGNRAIEQAAIEWVIQLEARHGRRAVDRRGKGGSQQTSSARRAPSRSRRSGATPEGWTYPSR